MDSAEEGIFRDPFTGETLIETEQGLINPVTGRSYPDRHGYYDFLQERGLQGDNRKYSAFYDRIAWVYNCSSRFFLFLKFGGEGRARREFLGELAIAAGDRVLEVSIGTGDNLPYLNRNARYFGIDISQGMLRMAVRHLRRWRIPARLCRAEAERLPFGDDSFEVVFHHGGINYFNDKELAIREMIRVAKPGATILISDETAAAVRAIYQKNPLSAKLYQDDSAAVAPVDLVPETMQDLRVKIVYQGLVYCLIFKKPLS